jgi:hypothetical protein
LAEARAREAEICFENHQKAESKAQKNIGIDAESTMPMKLWNG